jgi:hypothetical protein
MKPQLLTWHWYMSLGSAIVSSFAGDKVSLFYNSIKNLCQRKAEQFISLMILFPNSFGNFFTLMLIPGIDASFDYWGPVCRGPVKGGQIFILDTARQG